MRSWREIMKLVGIIWMNRLPWLRDIDESLYRINWKKGKLLMRDMVIFQEAIH